MMMTRTAAKAITRIGIADAGGAEIRPAKRSDDEDT